MNEQFLDRITLTQKNALRYRPTKKYDLVWIAGLFDYFDDRVFVRLLRRYMEALNAEGELVLGNFSDRNPSRPYMELLGGWHLHHRTELTLRELADEAGVDKERVRIGHETEGVNLFLHATNSQPILTSEWTPTSYRFEAALRS